MASAVTMAVLVMLIVLIVLVVFIVPGIALVAISIITIAMLFAVARCVFIGVPAILDKIHLLTARVIGAAVFRPVFCVAGRNAQIEWLPFDVARRAFDDDRLRIDHARLREVADIDAAVKTRLTDID